MTRTSSSGVVAVDTSVAVPLVHAGLAAHAWVRAAVAGRVVRLAGHAAVESYSVLTRLPGDARLAPGDAIALLDDVFGAPLVLDPERAADAPRVLARASIAGGATYDGLVALAARAHDAILLTRDARARSTYLAVGVRVEVLAG